MTIDGPDHVTGRVVSVTSYTYDRFANPIAVTDALGQTGTRSYDLNGNPLTVTDRNRNRTEFTYGDRGRELSAKVYAPDKQLLSYRDTTYTHSGAVRTSSNETVTLTYTYDELGRLITEAETGGIVKNYTCELDDLCAFYDVSWNGKGFGPQDEYDETRKLTNASALYARIEYEYDGAGNRTKMLYSGREDYVTTYTYDQNNRLLVAEKANTAGRPPELQSTPTTQMGIKLRRSTQAVQLRTPMTALTVWSPSM